MNFESEYARRTQEADQIVISYLPKTEGYAKTLLSAMDYSVRTGGKRLRPILMKLSYEMAGGHGQAVEPFMAAMEMIHTSSLVHDDLPAMDNDLLRRGKPTTHAVYSEGMAILVGDSLLNYAYETALKAFAMDADAELVVKALRILAAKTGIDGMIGGQSLDVEMNGRQLSSQQLDYIFDKKTGALIEGSLMVGAALAGAGEEDLTRLSEIGRRIGVAFQILDDILDVAGDQKLLGKATGSDEKNGKTTYVTLYGMERSLSAVKTLTQSAVAMLDAMGGQHVFLRELLIRLAGRKF